MRVFFLILALLALLGTARAEQREPIRFGLTPVVLRENLRFLDQWALYLSKKTDRPVEFVRRRSYGEIMDLLKSGTLDFAWICGYPFVQKRDPEHLKLLAVPVYKGAPLYHSVIIVHRDSPYRSLEDLRGKVFAFSDPDSNSGFLYPQFLLAEKNEKADTFFRHTFFTFNHAETVEAVAAGVADGAAVDSYIWEYMSTFKPEIKEATRVIDKSPAFGFPPVVARIGVDAPAIAKMKAALIGMADDPIGQNFLEGFHLDGFGERSPQLFDGIRKMAILTRQGHPLPALAAGQDRIRK